MLWRRQCDDLQLPVLVLVEQHRPNQSLDLLADSLKKVGTPVLFPTGKGSGVRPERPRWTWPGVSRLGDVAVSMALTRSHSPLSPPCSTARTQGASESATNSRWTVGTDWSGGPTQRIRQRCQQLPYNIRRIALVRPMWTSLMISLDPMRLHSVNKPMIWHQKPRAHCPVSKYRAALSGRRH